MTPKYWLALAFIVGLILFGFGYTASVKSKAVMQYAIADDVRVLAKATARADSIEKAFRVDTLKLFKRITHTDSIFAEVVKSDTLRLTDTVKVTVEVVREAVATLNACRETVRSCGQLNEQRKAQIDALTVTVAKMKALRPSLLSRCGISAGYGATASNDGRVSHGIAALAGCKVFP